MYEKEINVFFLSVILTVLLLVMAVYFVIISIRRRNILYKREREANAILHKQELLETRQEVQQKLMQNIGSELHDTIGQKLTLTYLQMENTLQSDNIDDIKTRISAQNALIQESLNELRSISKMLTTQDFSNFNFVHYLLKEMARINESGLCKTVFTYPDEHFDFLNEKVNLSLVRICQEFIQNSLKHSGCAQLEIHITLTDENLRIVCIDNGRGIDWEKASEYRIGSGSGLKSIERRINSIGAGFRWENKNGTQLHIDLPLNKIAADET
ncbi:two-component sensor histidine kinase [Niabella ginsenosidivorans]|uniref:histidine kinase n=1 Tax=Niabella ginsenosidivorans TaxID=1176587 RepID=A0A1A9I6T6_9BACT|nr:ATP-binding protein [Niabella ginsenosidivorans]ANH83388.1 two-component sensor histidine kinase [Niabella ginsenosidivorans]